MANLIEAPPRDNPVHRLCWTFNFHPGVLPLIPVGETFAQYHVIIQREFKRLFPNHLYIFQLEMGAENGLLHYQGYSKVKDDNKIRASTFANVCREFMPGIHVSPAVRQIGAQDRAEFYVMKEETRVDGPWSDPSYIVPDFSDIIPPTEGWTLQIANLIQTKAEQRFIWWIWENVGQTGKSNFCMHCEIKELAVTLSVGKAADILYAVSEMRRSRAYIFDMPRTQPANYDWNELYQSLESIKNRNIFVGKYKAKKCLLPVVPHVIVLANRPPHYEKLSLDRWKEFKIVNNELVPQNVINHMINLNDNHNHP